MTATCVGTKKCTCTYIAIKDGECANSTVIGQYCGHQITSGTLSPSGGYIRLVFVSHSRNSTNIWNRFDVMYAIGKNSMHEVQQSLFYIGCLTFWLHETPDIAR